MPDTIACGLCGRAFAPRRNGAWRYCGRCAARAVKEAVSVHRAKCKACGSTFQTPSRVVRYCSDPCRQRGYGARVGPEGPIPQPPRGVTAECGECGKAFRTPSRSIRYCSDPCRRAGYARSGNTSGLSRLRPASSRPPRRSECGECGRAFEFGAGPGRRVYCSDACRTKGRRARGREAMRRYLSDPRKRSLHAARVSAVHARYRAEAGIESERRVRCGVCGAEFSTPHGKAKYCSDPCRKKAIAAGSRRRWQRRRQQRRLSEKG